MKHFVFFTATVEERDVLAHELHLLCMNPNMDLFFTTPRGHAMFLIDPI